MKHIFDKFYQGDSSHKQEGNGLGLALVKQILNLCKGTVSVENIPGSGCRFTVHTVKQILTHIHKPKKQRTPYFS